MANIVTRITLEGAAAIKAELTALGKAGKDAWDKLGEVQGVGSRLSAAGVEMGKLTASVKTFGAAAAQAGKDGAAFGNAVSSSLLKLTAVAAGLGLAFGKVLETFKSVGAEAETLQQNAEAAGLSTKAYESLTLALGQNGVGSAEAAKGLDKVAKFLVSAKEESDAYNKALTKLNKENREGKLTFKEYSEKLKDLNDGMGKSAQLAERYKLKLTDASGELKNVRDFSIEFGEALNRSDNAARKNADSLAVFGKAGRKIGVAFGQGREALEALEERAQHLAPSLTDAAQKAVTGMDDAFDQLGQTGKSLQRELVSIFAGQVTGVVSTFTEAIADNRAMFIRLAETIRDQIRPAIVELVLFMSSPEFSLKLQATIIGIRDGFIAVGTAIKTVIIPAFRALLQFADQVAEGINKVFGTNLTGGGVLAAAVLLKVTGLFSVLTTGITFTVSAVRALVAILPVLGQAFNVLFAIIRANPLAALAFIIGALIVYVVTNFPQIRQAIVDTFTQAMASARELWTQFTTFLQGRVDAVVAMWTAIKKFFADLWAQALANARENWASVTQVINDAFAVVKAVWDGAIKYFTDLWAQVAAAFSAGWQAIKDGAQSAWDYISSSVTAPFAKMKAVMLDWWNFAKGLWDSAIQKAKDYFAASQEAKASGGPGGGDGAQSNAAGGYIRGRGTGTSDSILSWLSNGEFVVKAKAVQHYGPQLLSAINNMRLPRFNTGGMVEAAQTILMPGIPRFAGGGPVSAPAGGGRPMVLQIGDQVISGLTANSGAVETLQKYASQKAVRSAGRKPLWFKG